MDNVISVIVTGAGAPGVAGTIYALKNNPDKADIRIITIDIRDDVAGKYISDGFYKVPPPEDSSYAQIVKEIAAKEGIRAIIPQTTREIETLSRLKDNFESAGIGIVVSSHKSILMANNKFHLLERAREIDVPYPKYCLTRDREEFIAAVKELGYPERKVVVKPSTSNGMRGLRILAENAWDTKRFLGEKPDGTEIDLDGIMRILQNGDWPELIVMEYLAGPEYSVDVFKNSSGTIAIPRLRQRIRSGITFEAQIDLRNDIIEYSKRLSDALELEYCFGFQFKLSEAGVPKLLECNPRVQGTMVVSHFAGFNVIYYALKEVLGHEIDTSKVKLKDKVQFKRYWGGIAIDDGYFVKRI